MLYSQSHCTKVLREIRQARLEAAHSNISSTSTTASALGSMDFATALTIKISQAEYDHLLSLESTHTASHTSLGTCALFTSSCMSWILDYRV